MNAFHMEGTEFVALAKRVLGDQDRFEDDLLVIRRNYNGLGLEIERKSMPQHGSHLDVTNPTTMVTKDGEIIRHHGEHCYLSERLLTLAGVTDDIRPVLVREMEHPSPGVTKKAMTQMGWAIQLLTLIWTSEDSEQAFEISARLDTIAEILRGEEQRMISARLKEQTRRTIMQKLDEFSTTEG